MGFLAQLIALVVGIAIGLQLPDVDRVFFFLTHRSLLTHGFLIPLGLYWLVKAERSWLKAGVAGLALAIAIHLTFDLFPASWRGYAMINLPLFGQIGPTLSVLWLAISLIVCCYLVLRLVRQPQTFFTLLPVGLIGFIFTAGRERIGWFMPLLLLVVAFVIACFFPNPVIDGREQAKKWMGQARTNNP